MHQAAQGGAPGKGPHLPHFLVVMTYQVPEINVCPGQELGITAPEGLQISILAPSSSSECSGSFLETPLSSSQCIEPVVSALLLPPYGHLASDQVHLHVVWEGSVFL